MLCFLVTSVLRSALLPYYRDNAIHRNFHHNNILFLGESFSQSLKHVSIQIIENRDLFALQISQYSYFIPAVNTTKSKVLWCF